MQKKYTFGYILIFSFIYFQIYAQNQNSPITLQPATNAMTGATNLLTSSMPTSFGNGSYPNNFAYDDYKYYNNNSVYGNRFFYDNEYHQGELWTNSAYYSTEMQYKFDQIEGAIQVKFKDGKESLINEKEVIMFFLYINDKKIVFVKNDIPNGKKDALLQVIYYNNQLQMLRDAKKTLVKRSGTTYIENEYAYFIREDDTKPLEPIELTEKSFFQKFPQHKYKIMQFFKVNNVKKEITQTKLIHLLDRITGQVDKPETTE